MTELSILSTAPDELWRPVVGFEGLYEVSDLGRVRGLDRLVPRRGGTTRLQSGIVLRDRSGPKGYRMVGLCRGGLVSGRYVHRLVLEAFIGPCPPGQEACHRLGLRADNRLSELRWDTKAANQADRVTHGTDQRGERNACAVLSTRDVVTIRASPLSQRVLARQFGVQQQSISKIKTRIRWSHV